jgi:hypothetical protein
MTNIGPDVLSVPALAGTYFFAASDPAITSTRILNKYRPPSIAMARV